MDPNYDYQVDPNLSYNDNPKSHLTSIILGNLFRDYWANPSQREYILKKERQRVSFMRMRKKKNLEPRLERCEDVTILNPQEMRIEANYARRTLRGFYIPETPDSVYFYMESTAT